LLPGGSGYFTCIQNMKLVTNKFKSGGLHEKHVVTTWSFWKPSQHLLIDIGKTRKTCVEVAGRWTFRIRTSSQQSGKWGAAWFVNVQPSLYRLGQLCSVPRGWGPHKFQTSGMSALRTSRLYPQQISLVLTFGRGWVETRPLVRPEGFYINEKFELTQRDLVTACPFIRTT